MINEIAELHNDSYNFIKSGIFNDVWYYIKDIKNFEIRIYFDIQMIYDELLEEHDNPEKELEIFEKKYKYFDEFGVLVGRINYSGYYDEIKSEYTKFKLLSSKQENEIKSHIEFYSDQTKYECNGPNMFELENTEVPFQIKDINHFYKVCETIYLIVKEKIKDEHFFLIEDAFGSCESQLNIYGFSMINGVPMELSIFNIDFDELQCSLPLGSAFKDENFYDKLKKLMRTEYIDFSTEDKINSTALYNDEFLCSFYMEQEIGSDNITSEEINELSVNIENKFTKIYRENYDQIKKLLDITDKESYSTYVKTVLNNISQFKLNFEPRGIGKIISCIYKIFIVIMDKIDFRADELDRIKNNKIHLEIFSNIRNSVMHADNKADKNLLGIGIYCGNYFLKSLDLLEIIFHKIEIK